MNPIEINTLCQLVERLEGARRPIELHDDDRTVGYKIGQRELVAEIRNIINEMEGN